jgi:hypothetical protein
MSTLLTVIMDNSLNERKCEVSDKIMSLCTNTYTHTHTHTHARMHMHAGGLTRAHSKI